MLALSISRFDPGVFVPSPLHRLQRHEPGPEVEPPEVLPKSHLAGAVLEVIWVF